MGYAFALAVLMGAAAPARAQQGPCPAREDSPPVTVALPSRPFSVRPAADGRWVFVSLMYDRARRNAGMAVLKRDGGRIRLVRFVPLPSPPAGLALTHDGKVLVAAAIDAVIFLDVRRLTGGAANPVLGSFRTGEKSASIYANVTADDQLLFVSEEKAQSITVIDLERARRNGYRADAIIGKIPAGRAPIALTFSPDGKWLYTTSQVALPGWGWPKACGLEGSATAGPEFTNPEGAIIVVDVARARTDPAQSVVARVPAGCNPVRLAISPGGDRLYASARNSNAVLAFDTARLLSGSEHARIGTAPVGAAPVPIAVVDQGRKVVVGNSNRFDGSSRGESLVVLDAAKIQQGAAARLGTIPAGAFPRDMSVSADGCTLFLTNYGSNSLQVMNAEHLLDTPVPNGAETGPGGYRGLR